MTVNSLRIPYIYTLLVFFCIFTQETQAQATLFRKGKSDYRIVLSDNASATERTAARELQSYIRRMGNVTLPVTDGRDRHGKHNIYVGWNESCGEPQPDDDDEGFTYKTIGEEVHIFGGKERGTMYGVFSFLEQELGVMWLTSTCEVVPRRNVVRLSKLNHSERPAFARRLALYYDALRSMSFSAHNKLNTQYSLTRSEYGLMSAIWGSHTFGTLLPAEKYFKKHPEYFSIYRGERSDRAQLCLSNREMRREMTRNLLKVMEENPGYWCYDVSQNDNSNPCECSDCTRLVEKYGGQSGAMIWFVNEIAAEVKKTYPAKYLSTFAYRYTRQAPKSDIRVADNVVVRLCDIECCFAHSLEECTQNKTFLQDMDAWKRISKNIYLWDYSTAFYHYLLPFPDFDALSRDMVYFSHSNVIGILEEGAHDAPWGEFSEMKQWMTAKLLWNPYCNIDSLAEAFIDGYYGKAAPHVLRYYHLCKEQVKPDTHFTIKTDWTSGIHEDGFVNNGMKLMEKALEVCNNDSVMLQRVNRVVAQLYYIKVRRNVAAAATDGTLRKLVDILHRDRTLVREHGATIDDLLKEIGQI